MIIGIIGEAGVGKTTATKFFQKQGAHVIIADDIVKFLYKTPGIEQKIIKTFGDQVLTEDKKLDKKLLRKYVFQNHEALKQLEAIIWPQMVKIIITEITSHKDAPLVVLDCAVLFNAKLELFVNKIILIEADEKLKIDRIKIRDELSDVQVINLLNMQKHHLILDKAVDYIIKNNGTIDDFLTQLVKLAKKLNKK